MHPSHQATVTTVVSVVLYFALLGMVIWKRWLLVTGLLMFLCGVPALLWLVTASEWDPWNALWLVFTLPGLFILVGTVQAVARFIRMMREPSP